LKIKINDSTGSNGFNIFIDNNNTVLFTKSGSHLYEINCSLRNSVHNLIIMKRTEANLGITIFEGIELSRNATVFADNDTKNRKLEFYGDSFTAGIFINKIRIW
jgi:hypothetical protein